MIDSTVRLTGNGYTISLTDSPEQLHRRPGGAGWGMAPVTNSWFEGAADGDILRGTRRTRRELTIPIDAFGNSRAEIEDALRDLVRIIRTPFIVHIDREDGSSFSIPAVYESGMEGVYTTAPEFWNQLSIVLKCPDPYWTSDAEQTFAIAPTPADAPFLPLFAGLHVASASAFGEVVANNVGDVESRPTVTIQGPGVNPVIKVNNVGFTLTKTLTSSDLITIKFSGGGWTITDQAGVNQYAFLSSAPIFPVLPPGGSVVTANMTGTGTGSYIQFVYPERREVVY